PRRGSANRPRRGRRRRRQARRTDGHPSEHLSGAAVSGRDRIRSTQRGWPAPARFPLHAARSLAHRLARDVLPQRDGAPVLKALRRPAYGLEIIDHTIPSRLDAGETYGIRATLRNTGALTWPHAGPHPVELFVLIDGDLYQKVALPHGDVPPAGTVTFHFALRLAKAGTRDVRLEVVHHLKAWFRDHGAPGAAVEVRAEEHPPDRPAVALERSLARNVWHFQPTSSIRRLRDGSPLPLFVASAKGCRFADPEGHEFLDYTSAWGSTILGYADDRVQ